MDSFYLWTIGCQMNKADSERLGAALEQLGLCQADRAADADVVVLNSCVVRQNSEDKVAAKLQNLQPLKKQHPGQVLALMGCMVGPKSGELRQRFPYVDVFMRPQEYGPLLDLVGQRQGLDWEGCVGSLAPNRPNVACYVPIIHGCDLMCSFCIIPFRRGRQVSRPAAEVVDEVELLASRGVKEVTLLGQTVDAYGHDLPAKLDLADLLGELNRVNGLERIRFLTSHPSFMSERIIQAVAACEKCANISTCRCRRGMTRSWAGCAGPTLRPSTWSWCSASGMPYRVSPSVPILSSASQERRRISTSGPWTWLPSCVSTRSTVLLILLGGAPMPSAACPTAFRMMRRSAAGSGLSNCKRVFFEKLTPRWSDRWRRSWWKAAAEIIGRAGPAPKKLYFSRMRPAISVNWSKSKSPRPVHGPSKGPW